ncbi:hypothetical protein F4Y59_11360 [Candidatus Poribacteria bacterium]|nr:hypothetical protein [Candidatus Poribacteria bacterium]MXY28745.1 hypothetical protein [Candidatus Poribacteria bacterium]MYK20102.1 hypothetical protein [Candidatus Poribacteria bacterium]
MTGHTDTRAPRYGYAKMLQYMSIHLMAQRMSTIQMRLHTLAVPVRKRAVRQMCLRLNISSRLIDVKKEGIWSHRIPSFNFVEEFRFLEELRTKDPGVWVERMHAALIKRHGNIPEVGSIINFLRKLEHHLPRTDKECRSYLKVYGTLYDHTTTASTYEFYAMLEARDQLRQFVGNTPERLKKYRDARAKGISFNDIDWDHS